jgi:hypothetical protein
MQMETKDLVPVITIVNGSIQENLSVIEARVKEITEQYKGLVVTNVKEAKETLANLRKLFKAINDEKIKAKKAYLEPFEEIEARVKALGALIDVPVAEIDLQIKAAEQRVKEERVKQIAELEASAYPYLENPTVVEFYQKCPWRTDPRWENQEYWTSKGYPTGKLKEEITEKAMQCKSGVNTILMMAGEFADQILEAFRTNGNLGVSLELLRSKKEAKAQCEALAQTLPMPEAPKFEPEAPVEAPVEDEPHKLPAFMREQEPDTPAWMRPVPPDGKKSFTVRVVCTDSEFTRVRAAIMLAGIQFEVL